MRKVNLILAGIVFIGLISVIPCILVQSSSLSSAGHVENGSRNLAQPLSDFTVVRFYLSPDALDVDANLVPITLEVFFSFDYNASFDQLEIDVFFCEDTSLVAEKIGGGIDWSNFEGSLTTHVRLGGTPHFFPFDFYTMAPRLDFNASLFDFTQYSPVINEYSEASSFWQKTHRVDNVTAASVSFSINFSRPGWVNYLFFIPLVIGLFILGSTVMLRKNEDDEKNMASRTRVFISLLLWFVGTSFSLQGLIPASRNSLSIIELFNYASVFYVSLFLFFNAASHYLWDKVERLDPIAVSVAALLMGWLYYTNLGVIVANNPQNFLVLAIQFPGWLMISLFAGPIVVLAKWIHHKIHPPSATKIIEES